MAQQQSSIVPVPLRRFEDLLLWKDVPKSGAVFGAATIGYLVLCWSGWSLVALTSNILLVVVLASSLWCALSSLFNKPGPGASLPAFMSQGISPDTWKYCSDAAHHHVDQALGAVHTVLSGESWRLNAQVLAGLFGLGRFGHLLSPLTVLYTVVLLAFTVPVLYERNKQEVDAFLARAHHHARAAYSDAHASVMQQASGLVDKAKSLQKKSS